MKTITISLFLSLGLVSTLPYIPINYIPAYYPLVYPVYQQVRLQDPPPTAPIVINIEEDGYIVDYDCTQEGLFLDTNTANCTSYIQCFVDDDSEGGWRKTRNKCPETLAFNSDIENCDFDYNVNCNSRQAPSLSVEPVIVEVHELCEGLTGD